MTRRARYLVAFGLLHIALGFAVVAQEAASVNVNIASMAVGQVVPPPIYGPASILGGALCILLAIWTRKSRFRLGAKKAGFAILAVLLVARVLAHLWAAAVGVSPELGLRTGLAVNPGAINPLQQLATGTVYSIVVYAHLLVAGWPDEVPLAKPITAYDLDPVRFTEDAVKVMAEKLLNDDARSAEERRQLETDLTEIAQYGRLLTAEERIEQAHDPEGTSHRRRGQQADEVIHLHDSADERADRAGSARIDRDTPPGSAS